MTGGCSLAPKAQLTSVPFSAPRRGASVRPAGGSHLWPMTSPQPCPGIAWARAGGQRHDAARDRALHQTVQEMASQWAKPCPSQIYLQVEMGQ